MRNAELQWSENIYFVKHESVEADEVKSVGWDGRDVQGKEIGSGIYLYKLKTKDGEYSKKMLLIK